MAYAFKCRGDGSGAAGGVIEPPKFGSFARIHPNVAPPIFLFGQFDIKAPPILCTFQRP